MRYEFSLVRKYLFPHRKPPYISLLTFVSFFVITIVTWMSLLFFSINDGIESTWLNKLTSISSSIRIVPSEKYYSSQYYLNDSFAEKANYTLRTLDQKKSDLTPLYDIYNDKELPQTYSPTSSDIDIIPKALNALDEIDIKYSLYNTIVCSISLIGHTRSKGMTNIQQTLFITNFSECNTHLIDIIKPYSVDEILQLLTVFPEKAKVIGSNILLNGKPVPDELLTLSSLQNALIDLKTTKGLLTIIKTFSKPPTLPPLWPYVLGQTAIFPALKENTVILPSHFQKNGVQSFTNSQISVATKSFSGILTNKSTAFISGFYDPGLIATGARFGFTTTSFVNKFAKTAVTNPIDPLHDEGIAIWLEKPRMAIETAKSIDEAFKKAGISPYFDVYTYEDFPVAKEIVQQFKSDKLLLTVVGGAITLVATTSIISLLLLLVTLKRKEIAIIRSLGARTSSILLIFGSIGVVIGIISIITALILSQLTLYYLESILNLINHMIGYSPLSLQLFDPIKYSHISRSAVTLLCIITPLFSLISALIPAALACRISTVEILKDTQ